MISALSSVTGWVGTVALSSSRKSPPPLTDFRCVGAINPVAEFSNAQNADNEGNVADSFLNRFDSLIRSEVSGVPPRSAHWNRGLIPGGWFPWLTMGLDTFFDIAGKVLVHNRIRLPGLQTCNHFGDHSPRRARWFDNGNGAVVLFNDNLNALPDLSQHGSYVFHHFGLGHVEDCHAFDHSEFGSAGARID